MERLQQALQKARQQRLGADPAATAAAAAPDRSPAARTDDLWRALVPYDPSPRALEANRVVTASAGELAAPFDILRTKVLFAMRKNGWRRLAITSPTAACGKSTTACNLALGISRQPDLRAMLFECDLRRPSIVRKLALPARPDITEMLAGQVAFADQAVRFRDNVAVSAATRSVADPSALLLTNTTQDTLSAIEAEYAPDLMIFDLPPLLIGDHARAFLKNVDCALIVTRAEGSTVAQIDACEREIAEQTNVLGVVLNQCQFSDDVHGGYYTAGSGEA